MSSAPTGLIPDDLLDRIDEVVYAVETDEGNPMQGTVRLLNRRVEHLLGYAPEEFLSDPGLWFSLIHPDDHPQLIDRSREIYASRRPGIRVYRVRHKYTGEYHSIEDSVTPRLDASGRMIGVFGVARDVTERRVHDERTVRLAQAVDQTADMVVIADCNGVIEYVNPAFEVITGYGYAEAIGATPRLVKSDIHDRKFYQHLWATILAGEVFNDVLLNRKKDGTFYYEQKTITPIRNASGQITHFVSTGKDITKRRQEEAGLLRAQKMEAVGRLAAGVAHDFNNMMTVVTGYGGLLRSALVADKRLAEQAEAIVEAGVHAAELAQQLLAFSRQQHMVTQVLQYNDVVRRSESMLRSLLGKRVEFLVRLDPSAGSVRADLSQLEQVIVNLAVNARDAMPEGGRILLETANVELGDDFTVRHPGAITGHHVRLSISDTGCGMSAETMARIFEPYFTTKPNGKGTGLGLATVYGIMKQSGGYIDVESRQGSGTTFAIYLPRVMDAPVSPLRHEESGPAPGGRETVLLVEDDAAVRAFIANALRQLGYAILEATSGEMALGFLEASDATRPELMIADVAMPGMSCQQLVERYVALRPASRVLLVSGYANDDAGLPGVAAAKEPFLQKPFSAPVLAQKVREVLDRPA